MNVTAMKLSALHPIRKNVRRHSEKQIGEYVRSLTMFGQLRPMVVDEDGMILVGNGMFEAMKRAGWEQADCYIVTGLTEAQKTKLMLADNRVYELGMTDMDAFDELIAELDGDFDIPGWDEDLLETLNASMADATEMVQNYGVYPQDDVQRVQEKEAHTEHAAQDGGYAPPQGASYGALQQPSGGQDNPEPAPHRAETQAASDPAEAVPGRHIICPHCGERIIITPAMIGGE